jgi:hypothetical protein
VGDSSLHRGKGDGIEVPRVSVFGVVDIGASIVVVERRED